MLHTYSTFNIVLLVKEVMELLEDKAEERKIKLVFKKEYDKPIKVSADKAKIEQVLINLIANAIKYGKEKGKVRSGVLSFVSQESSRDAHKILGNEILIKTNDTLACLTTNNPTNMYKQIWTLK